MRCVLGGDDDAIPGRRLMAPLPAGRPQGDGPAMDGARAALQRAMTADAGVLRSADSLERARDAASSAWARARLDRSDRSSAGADSELANLATVGWALATSALARTESRGAHARTDHPDVDPEQRLRYVFGGVVQGP